MRHVPANSNILCRTAGENMQIQKVKHSSLLTYALHCSTLLSGCALFCHTDFLWLFRDQKLHKSITYREVITDYQRQSVTDNACLLKVTGSSSRLSVIQRIVNHWFYIMVNDLCK